MSESEKKKRISAIKGTKDILPDEVGKWQRVETTAANIFQRYGYKEIRSPLFEATELYQKGTGETTDVVQKEMYTFIDKGGRSITLRPEYTPSVARAIIEHNLYLNPEPLRYYFIGPMFRYDKPQKGRYRQFHQIDIEVFAEKDPAVDAEIVEMADRLLNELEVPGYKILINSVGCPSCRPEYLKKLREKALESEEELCPDCRRKIHTNPLRIFDCKLDSCRSISLKFPKITDYLCDECEEHFKKFCAYLDSFGIKYEIEPRLVRGLDYYTKTTFEFITEKLGAQDSVLGGGRYDNMMKEFGGPDISGTGFAVGLERLLSIVPEKKESKKFIYIVYLGEEAKLESMLLARFLRSHGISCLLEYKGQGLKKQMGRANKLNAAWTLIVGEDEVKNKKYQLKEMVTGQQHEVTREDIVSLIQKVD
ncbi:MAG: histidine--tRNA ligase [Candidatus Aminicenantes bacterium]|nr:histidine--tRNA ligase [Candidatus Aminicenantes bacterium]